MQIMNHQNYGTGLSPETILNTLQDLGSYTPSYTKILALCSSTSCTPASIVENLVWSYTYDMVYREIYV
jgi:hypothetical protein